MTFSSGMGLCWLVLSLVLLVCAEDSSSISHSSSSSPVPHHSKNSSVSRDDGLDSLWMLKSGRRMACSDVESSRMKTHLRQFKKVWKSAYKRLEKKIGLLEKELHTFSEEASTTESLITNRINASLSDEQKVLRKIVGCCLLKKKKKQNKRRLKH